MGARQKLNSVYFTGCLAVAGIVGAASASWLVFGVCLSLLVGGQFVCGNIRFPRRKK